MMRRLLVTLAIVIAFVACKEKQPAARAVTPPTMQEAEQVGKELAKHLAPCDASTLDRMIDVDLILTRAVANKSMRSNDRKGLARGFGGLGQRMCQELADPGLTATYLRTQTIDGTPRPLIRILFKDGGLNYYQFELDKGKATIRVADVYLYVAGEAMSATLGGLLDLLMSSSSSSSSTVKIVNEVKEHMRAERWAEAHARVKALPAAFRAAKAIKLMEVTIAAEVSDDAYLAAMDEYAKAYPNDASLALVQIDHTLLRKEYAATLAAVDKIDKQVGGDPYLDIMRVDAYSSLGKHAEALAAAKRGVAAEPAIDRAWWALLTAQTGNALYAEALPTLETLRDKFGADIATDTIGGDERFAALVASDPYKAWLAR